MKSAESFKRIRDELCLNRTEIAKMLGLTASMICLYEKGTRNPSRSVIRKVLELAKKNKIKISVKDFFE